MTIGSRELGSCRRVRLARPQVVAAYPITPQTPIVERIADFISGGALPDTRYIAVESEHLRSVLWWKHPWLELECSLLPAPGSHDAEVVGVASGNRLPILMAVANRALPSPWSLQADHSDSMAGAIWDGSAVCGELSEALDFVLLGIVCGDSSPACDVVHRWVLLVSQHRSSQRPKHRGCRCLSSGIRTGAVRLIPTAHHHKPVDLVRRIHRDQACPQTGAGST